MDVSPANFRDWRTMTSSFSEMGAYTEGESANLVGAGEPARLNGSDVTAALLPIFGVAPAKGRLFLPEDDRAGAPGTVVLSDAVWRVKFGGDPAIIGKIITLDDEACTVIGVMPASFEFPSRTTDFWRPIRFGPDSFTERDNTYLRVIARLRPGVSRDQARRDVTAAAAGMERAYPKENAKVGATLIQLRDEVNPKSRQLLVALMGAAACVLLIACTNLASLLVARTSAREREMAVRAALGAGRERLVRQLMTESLLLAFAGGVLGVLVAVIVLPLVAALVPTSLPIANAPALDVRMLVIAAAVTLATGIGFGVLPAARLSRPSGALRDGARAGTSRHSERVRAGLVIAQVAASVALLVGAGLLIRALWRVQHVDPGFRADGALTLRTTLPLPKYRATATRAAFYRRVLDDVRALPGVTAAGYTSFLPMSSMRGGIWRAYQPGETRDIEHGDAVSVRYITPQFFDAMGMSLKLGRAFTESDSSSADKVAVVSESFARAHWPTASPIGRRFFLAFFDRTIVGVVADVRVRGLERESEPQAYLPYQQQLDDMMGFYIPQDLVVRGSQDARAVREIIARADPQLPVSDVSSLAAVVEDDTAARAAQVRVLGAFAALACVLAAIGLHGLLAFVVTARTREIGVRLALGAAPRDVMTLIAVRGAMLAGAGIIAGAVAAILAGRSMQSLLAGVPPADPATLGAAAAVTLVLALAGSLIPAIRASRIQATEALRAD